MQLELSPDIKVTNSDIERKEIPFKLSNKEEAFLCNKALSQLQVSPNTAVYDINSSRGYKVAAYCDNIPNTLYLKGQGKQLFGLGKLKLNKVGSESLFQANAPFYLGKKNIWIRARWLVYKNLIENYEGEIVYDSHLDKLMRIWEFESFGRAKTTDINSKKPVIYTSDLDHLFPVVTNENNKLIPYGELEKASSIHKGILNTSKITFQEAVKVKNEIQATVGGFYTTTG